MLTSARSVATRCALVVAAHSSMLSIGTALAESRAESTVIQFRGLDLSTDAGIKDLYGRIRTAAWQVCFRETNSHGGVDQQARLYQCYEDAVVNAVQHINQAGLVALHRAQSRFAAN